MRINTTESLSTQFNEHENTMAEKYRAAVGYYH